MNSRANNVSRTFPTRQTQYGPSFAPPVPRAALNLPSIRRRRGAKQPSSALKNRVPHSDAIRSHLVSPDSPYFCLRTSSFILPFRRPPSPLVSIPSIRRNPVILSKKEQPQPAEKNPVPFENSGHLPQIHTKIIFRILPNLRILPVR
jgi:hypothetical protein